MADEEIKKAIKIDINDPSMMESLEEQLADMDQDADAFALPAPPPDGMYDVKLKLADAGWEKRYSKKLDRNFLQASLELRIIDPGGDFDDRPVFDQASDIVMQSNRTCRIAGILKALGETVPARITNVALCRQFSEVILTEPTVRIKIRWEAWSKEQEKTVKRGMANFPKDGNDRPMHVFEDPNTGEEITANPRIQRYLPVE